MPPSWVSVLAVGACYVLLLAGCNSKEAESGAPTPPTVRLSVPLEITVKQRTTNAVPGSNGKLLLTIDDITRDQVMSSMALEDGGLVLPMRSMSPKDAATFKFGDSEYMLELKRLDNELIGDDTATFVISVPNENNLSEETKIEKLIDAVANLSDATFVRNGSEHSAAEAADHLRTKWQAARDRITTAEEFIEHVASKSSISGKPYQIKMADGTIVNAGGYLRKKLATMQNLRD